MAGHQEDGDHNQTESATQSSAAADGKASVALLPEPFTVDAEAVGLAAAAARAVLRRTTGALGRFPRASQPPVLDPLRPAAEPLKAP